MFNFSASKPLSRENLTSSWMGSAPGERIKIRGVEKFESSKDFIRSNFGDSTKELPIFTVINF